MTRSQKAFRNVFFSTGTYLIQLILSMVVRVFFIRYIGREYLGLNSVYSSILSTMSIADLGLDTVFIYLLYRPLKEKNFSDIKTILNQYRSVYRIIALLISILGVILIPFLPSIIGKQSGLSGVYIIFILYIINAVVGYLNAYKRSLFIADQNGYIVNGITSGFVILVNLVQIIQIAIYPSPILYMIIQVLGTVGTNTLISYLVEKKYHEISKEPVGRLKANERKTLIQNGIGGVSNKIGSIVVVSSDNILLSIFTNLITVGMYSNYTVLTTALNKVMQTISSAITPSLGQLGVEGNRKQIKEVFLELSFIMYTLATFAFFGFYGFITPFVTLWLGKQNVFDTYLTWLVSINLWLSLIRVPSWMFADSFGLQWVQRWKSVFESIINLAMSLVFLIIFHLGIEGIILGTISSTLLTVIWYEPWTVFQHIIRDLNLRQYFVFNLPFIGLVLTASFLFKFGATITVISNNFMNSILVSIIIFLVLSLLYFFIFYQNKYFRKMVTRLYKLIRRTK